MMQPTKRCLLLALGLALVVRFAPAADERPIIEENQGKALLIYNIAKFTVWPPAGSASGDTFTYTLWDDSALANAFSIIEGQQTQGREVRITNHHSSTIPWNCDVLIISKQKLNAFIQANDEIQDKPILTVTTDPEVFDAGAMVLVKVVDERLSFSVNLGAVKASGLEISGNLLRHAEEVNF